MSIRNRLTLLYTSILVLVLFVFSIGLYWTLKYSLYQQIDSQLQARADEIQAQLLVKLGEQTSPVLEDSIAEDGQSFLQNPGIFAEISDPNGISIPSPVLGSLLMPQTTGEIPSTALWSTVEVEGQPVRLLSVPMTLPNQPPVVLRVGQSLAPAQQTLDRLALLLSIGTALATAISITIGLTMSERALSPIASMSARARDIVEHNRLDTRLPVVNPDDELGQLATTFNEALAQIEHLFQTQRRFVADAAHELRTPLTSIRGYVGLMKRGAWQDKEVRDEALGVIDQEAGRLTRLVNDLLLIAQSENKTLEIMEQPVSLIEILTTIVRQEERLLPPHEWIWKPSVSPVVNGDSDRLHQLFLNIIDNARRHTPENCRITVSMTQENDKAIIAVTDTGPGVPEEMLPHLFEPFFRADPSRNLTGTGLGLAIAKRLAEAHKGRITVTNNATGGATFTVALPLLEEPFVADTPTTQGSLSPSPSMSRGRQLSNNTP